MADVLVDLLEFSSSLHLFTFSYSDAGSAPTVDPPIPTSPKLFPESSGSRESPSTPFKTQESIEQRELQNILLSYLINEIFKTIIHSARHYILV
jgi:hypothetical protein